MNFQVGCVPYLNAVPLVARMPDQVQVRYAVPSQLPAWLGSGEVHAILVSSIEALRRPGARVAAGVSISSQDAVESVRLFSRVPFEEIQTLALDQSSMTSNALAQILLAERFGIKPIASPMPPDLDLMLASHDAGLLIGDNGMRADGDGLHVLDLGEAWHELTNLPFVWAMWLGQGGLEDELAELLQDAKIAGVADVESLIPEASERFAFNASVTRSYLTQTMDYDLTPDHLKGLEKFGSLCIVHGLLPSFTMPECVGRVKALR